MVFLSSQIKLEDLPDTKGEICNYEWFLFSIMIQNKNIRYDDELCRIYNRLVWHPFVHEETLCNYLIANRFYFKSNLYEIMKDGSEIVYMSKNL